MKEARDQSTKHELAPHLLILKITNLTSEFEIYKSDNVDDPGEAVEVSEHEITMDLPGPSCAEGQMINIEGVLALEKENYRFEATAKILKIDKGKKRSRLFVELHNHEVDLWKEFLQELKEKQERLDRLFVAMKGTK